MKQYLNQIVDARVRKDDMQRLESLGLDPASVRERLGISNSINSRVYRYGLASVVKIPQLSRVIGTTADSAKDDLDFLQQHLPEFVPDTEVITDKNSSDYAVLQQYLPHARQVSITDPNNVIYAVVELINESLRLMERFGKMPTLTSANEVIDSVTTRLNKGTNPTKKTLGNVVSIAGGHVFLVDTNLLDAKKRGVLPFSSMVANKILAQEFRDQAIERVGHTITSTKSVWVH